MNLIQPAGLYKLIPDRIKRLNELAYNLWWSWNSHAQQLFIDVDPALWELVYHNPVRFLNEVVWGGVTKTVIGEPPCWVMISH